MKIIATALMVLTFFLHSYLNAQEVSERRIAALVLTEKSDILSFSSSNEFDNPDKAGSKSLCVPQYSAGCAEGDGFVSFAVEQIQNYNSGCANLNGNGWSQYLNLGPAILLPGNTYTFFMQTGYSNQHTTIWIDFNDDSILTENEKILSNFIMVNAGELYSVQITLPNDATPGQHFMRARTRWSGDCDDPCASYQYGEAEDYLVFIGIPAFGNLSGVVTKLADGSPVAGASIELTGITGYSAQTGIDGVYTISNIMIGDYDLVCNKPGFNVPTITITVLEDSTLIHNFQMTQPNMLVEPLILEKNLPPGASGSSSLIISNSGNGTLDWSASILITSKYSKDFMDLQFQYPVAFGGGEAGIATDGYYIYTSRWNGPEFYKYTLDGIFLESFTISGVTAIRDLAFDGNHFYGAAATPQVFEMDFTNKLLISSFMAPSACRALAYSSDLEVFYANNWSSPVVMFDKAGNDLGSFNVGPAGEQFYGFAWDPATPGGPYLWGYAQMGSSLNTIVQMQLPSGTETGFTLDLASILTGTFYNGAGGLFAYPHLITGTWTLGGLVQNQWMWGLELADAITWISLSPSTGIIAGGNAQEILVLFDASELEAGVYNAEILMTPYPDIGMQIIDATLNVISGSPPPPNNLSALIDCDSLTVCWNTSFADSCSVYNFGSPVANTPGYCFTFYGPDNYAITITAWFGGIESEPSEVISTELLWPPDNEPVNLLIEVSEDIAHLYWAEPPGCAVPEGYNVYRNGLKINEQILTQMYYPDTLETTGTYEYYMTAVYYFGESGPSNIVVVSSSPSSVNRIESDKLQIYPNPAKAFVMVEYNATINKLELTDQAGTIIISKDVYGHAVMLNLESVSAGIYILGITTDYGLLYKKVLIHY